MQCNSKNCDLYKLPFANHVKNVKYLEFGRQLGFFEQQPDSKIRNYIDKLTDSKLLTFLDLSYFSDNTHGFHFIIRCLNVFHVCVVKCKILRWDVLRLILIGNIDQHCNFYKLPKSILRYIVSFIEIDSEMEKCDVRIEDVQIIMQNTIGVSFADGAKLLSNDRIWREYVKFRNNFP
jgi:hypothetical protein